MSPRNRPHFAALAAAALACSLIAPAPALAGPPQAENRHKMTFDEIIAELEDHGPGAAMLAVAHRGQWREAPENSIPAIEHAIEDGAEIIELDVRFTKDEVPVLMHDDSVDRTTDGSGTVSDLTYAQIQDLRLREGLGGEQAGVTDQQVPTLRQALEAVENKAMINIDKAGADPRVMALLQEMDMVDHGLFKGSDQDDAIEFLEEYPDAHYVHIITDRNYAQALDWPGAQPDGYEVTFRSDDAAQAQPDYLAQLRQKGRIWINTMWGSLAAGNTDETSLRKDTHLGWDNVVRTYGATMVQTDNVEAFDYWREGGPLHLWERQPGRANTVRVQAEEPVAFKDNDPNHCDSVSPEHADLDVCDQSGAKVLGWIRGGEWVEYTVDLKVSGTYDVKARVSTPYAPGGTAKFTWDGEPGAVFSVDNTTDHDAFEQQHVERRHFEKGVHTFRVAMPEDEYQNFNIDYFQFDRVHGKR